MDPSGMILLIGITVFGVVAIIGLLYCYSPTVNDEEPTIAVKEEETVAVTSTDTPIDEESMKAMEEIAARNEVTVRSDALCRQIVPYLNRVNDLRQRIEKHRPRMNGVEKAFIEARRLLNGMDEYHLRVRQIPIVDRLRIKMQAYAASMTSMRP